MICLEEVTIGLTCSPLSLSLSLKFRDFDETLVSSSV